MVLPLWFKILACVLAFFMGASVYSFLNVVIFRVPRGEEFVKTRSHCPGCGKILTPLELVPVVSYVCLGGKCKKCGSKIGCRDVLIEVFGGLSAIASFWINFQKPAESFAASFVGEFYAQFLAGLTAFAMIGALTVITFIQNDMGVVKLGTIVALGVIALLSLVTTNIPDDLMDLVIGALCLSMILILLHLIFKKAVPLGLAWMVGIAGFALGWAKMLLITLPVAVAFAILELIFLVITRKKPLSKSFKIVFALSIGLVVAILAGDEIIKIFGVF